MDQMNPDMAGKEQPATLEKWEYGHHNRMATVFWSFPFNFVFVLSSYESSFLQLRNSHEISISERMIMEPAELVAEQGT